MSEEKSLVKFEFEKKEVRIITDETGEPWWVAKDVCEILEHTNPSIAIEMLDEDERAKKSLGRQGETWIINESGLYTLIMRSNKPQAKPFRRWVTGEVLPAIRKTGGYSVPRAKKTVDQKRITFLGSEFRAAHRLAKVFGLEGNQALLSADICIRQRYGESAAALIGMEHLPTTDNERLLTPTEIGAMTGHSNREINRLLFDLGLQVKSGGYWITTESGHPYGVLMDTGKRHTTGTPVQQLKWKESVLRLIK